MLIIAFLHSFRKVFHFQIVLIFLDFLIFELKPQLICFQSSSFSVVSTSINLTMFNNLPPNYDVQYFHDLLTIFHNLSL